jgi:hypothetical protein
VVFQNYWAEQTGLNERIVYERPVSDEQKNRGRLITEERH